MYHRVFQCVLALCVVLECTCGQSSSKVYYKADGILVEEEQIGSVKVCNIHGDSELILKKLASLPEKSIIIEKRRDEIQNIINNCSTDNYLSRQKRDYNLDLIYPGTKWCGNGDAADDYDDLGKHQETDMCCREHDFCPDNIASFTSKHGLFNYGLFTMSNCECDDRFYNCLKNSTDEAGPIIGNVYFNVLGFDCFEMKTTKTCLNKGWWSRCKTYEEKMTYVPNKKF